MAMANRTTPPSPDTRPGRNPGYAEPQPRDKGDAQQREPRTPPDPEDGGLQQDRDPAPDPDHPQ
jgi:hypothetical protein